MKVFNLRCARDHVFEGWFASEEAFGEQRTRGLVECPLCGDHEIVRLPSAPRLNLSGAREEKPGPLMSSPQTASPESASLEAMWMKAVQHVLQNTEDVGAHFPEEARRIHYGEVERRGIRGEATPQQREALAEEGIEVMQMPMPKGLEGGGGKVH
jgi:hypothetical protein